MDPKRQSVPEAGAYRMLEMALGDLRKAERALTIVEEAAPDAERATHLQAVRAAIAQLSTVVTPLSE